MIHTVGSFEAKTRLAELLRQAERGDEIIIMRRGARIAVILGQARYEELSAKPADGWASRIRETAASMPALSKRDIAAIVGARREGLA